MGKARIFGVLLFSLVAGCAWGSEYVPQVREGVEWGYVRSSLVPGGSIEFFRLQFDGVTEIEGKEYHNLYMYDTFFLFPASNSPVAWMREENGKVYSILNPEFSSLAEEAGCIAYEGADGKEVLLMDYNVEVDGSFRIGAEGSLAKAVCTSIETVNIGNEERRMFTLRLYDDIGGEYTVGKDLCKVVEGIGPMSYSFPGDGSFLFPFCQPLTGIGYPQPYDGWLYEREAPEIDTSSGVQDLYVYTMGNITSRSPIFDYCGVHDPTVWYWMDSREPSGIAPSVSDRGDVSVKAADGGFTVSSSDTAISFVRVYGADGRLLHSAKTAKDMRSLTVPLPSEKMMMVQIGLSDGKTCVRKIVRR